MKNLLWAGVITSVTLPLATAEVADPLTVYVTATRAPETSVDTASSIRIISAQEIKESGAQSVADLLRGQHGIHVYDLYGDSTRATIDMRGFSTTAVSNVLIMVDGRRLNSATDGATISFNDIPTDRIERIEVVYGSSGVLFGNQAVGGVINIITKLADPSDVAEIQFEAGSFERQAKSLLVTKSVSDHLSLTITGKDSKTDGYRDNNSSDSRSLAFSSTYKSESHGLTLTHQRFDEFGENPGALFIDEVAADRKQSNSVYTDDFTATSTKTTSFNYTQKLADNWSLQTDGLHRRDDVNFRLSSRWGTRTHVDRQQREVLNFSPRLQGAIPTEMGVSKLTFGMDLDHTDYGIYAVVDQEAEQDVRSVYGQLIYPVTYRTDVSAGLRYANVKNDIEHDIGGVPYTNLRLDDDVTVGSIGLTYRPNNALRLFARADQNYRFANLEEHTNDETSQAYPTPPEGLKNQTGLSLETGLEYSSGTTSFFAQLYQLDLENEISYSSVAASGSGANVNLDSTTRRGINLSISEKLSDSLQLGIDFDFTAGKITGGDHKGKYIPMVPKQKVRTFARWQASNGLSFVADVLHVSDQVLDSDYDNSFSKLSNYTVANLGANYQVDGWNLSARINNLFDRKFSEYGTLGNTGAETTPTGHGQCQAGSWGTEDCPAFTPAPERNLWIGLKYVFK